MIDDNNLLIHLKTLVGEAFADEFSNPQADLHRRWLAGWLAPAEMPVAIAKPQNVGQIQGLVRLAGDHQLNLMTTPNTTGVGATINPSPRQSVLIDLSRMNRVVEFDENSAFALLEPGVTFTELLSYINVNDAKLWVDCERNGADSVCGSICERGFGNTPYGDHLLMQCGFEAVLANGEVMRTGMGALPNNNTWQLFKFNYGPYIDGLFSRSANAIVTKVGLWLMPQPPKFLPFKVALVSDEALRQTIEFLRPHKIAMTIPNTVVISHRGADQLLGPQADVPSSAEWNLYGALYGIPKNVDLTWQAIEPGLVAIDGGITQSGNTTPADPIAKMRTDLMRGVPAYHELDPPRTSWFTASAPIEGDAAVEMKTIVDRSFAELPTKPALEFALTWRTMLLRVELPVSGDQQRNREVMLAASDALFAAGYAVTHDSPDLRNHHAEKQTGLGLKSVYRHIDAALDPGGIFKPV